MLSSYLYTPDDGLLRELKKEEIASALGANGTLWVHVAPPEKEEMHLLAEVFNFHPLAVEDCLHRHVHPKLEEYANHLFLVIYGLQAAQEERHFVTSEYDVFLGKNFLVTVHDQPSEVINQLRERLEHHPGLLAKSPCLMMYHLLDAVVDNYFPFLEQLERRLDRIENQIFVQFSEGSLKRVFATKKEVLSLRRLLSLQREILRSLSLRPFPYVDPATQVYLRDVYDHIIRIFDNVEIVREMLFSALEAYTSQVSNRMNAIMKTLSIVATIMLPLTLIASVFGMNFAAIPGLESPSAFWITMGGMAAISGGLMLYFRKKGWF